MDFYEDDKIALDNAINEFGEPTTWLDGMTNLNGSFDREYRWLRGDDHLVIHSLHVTIASSQMIEEEERRLQNKKSEAIFDAYIAYKNSEGNAETEESLLMLLKTNMSKEAKEAAGTRLLNKMFKGI